MAGKDETRSTAYKNMVMGAAWSFAMRWGLKLIGLVSTLILARLLTPYDFGIVALAGIVFAFLESFMTMGIASLLIRESKITSEFRDTAWTLQMLQGIFLAVILYFLAGPASLYFDEPAIVNVIYMYCISAVVGGTESLGAILNRRDLKFSRDFSFHIYKRLIRFAVVVTLAIVIRNFWALVIGQLVATVLNVMLSYLFHEYRPGLCLKYWRKYLRFARSIIPLNIAKILGNKIDLLIVGESFGTATVGFYNVASQLGALFTREVILPISRGLLPNLAKVKSSPELLKEVYGHLINMVCLIALPMGLGLCSVSGDLVPVLLGEQWTEAIPLLGWLSLSGAFASILFTLGGQVQIVTGHEHVSAILAWVKVFTLAVSVNIFSSFWGVEGAAIGVFVSTVVLIPVYALQLNRPVGISIIEFCSLSWRPLFASTVMFVLLEQHDVWLAGFSHLSSLIIKVGSGFFIYCAALGLLWLLAGRPQSVEVILIGKLYHVVLGATHKRES